MDLRPYQRNAVDFALKNPRCAIWADPGMGKTRIVIALLERLRGVKGAVRALVVAPLAVAKYTWPDEVAKTSPLARCAYAAFPAAGGIRITTVNYERLPQFLEPFNKENWPFDIIIADEALRLKGFRTRQGGIRAKLLSNVAFNSRRFVELTGFPAPNSLEDLWGQLWYLDRGKRLGESFYDYTMRWFIPSGYRNYNVSVRPGASEEIAKAVSDICFPIKAADHLQMPEQIETDIPVELPDVARKQYRAMERDYFLEFEGEEHYAATASAKSMKLLQMASGSLYTHTEAGFTSTSQEIHREKINALRNLMNSFHEPLIVAYWFNSDLERLGRAFPEGVAITGKNAIDRWNAGEVRLLFLHPASAGHGLNLQHGGRAICWYTLPWDLDKYLQANERIGPARQAQIGRKAPVMVYRLVARKTIDEAVLDRLRTKETVQEALKRYVAKLNLRETP